MNIQLKPRPSSALVYRHKHTKLILQVIEADGEWLRIDPAEVAPGSPFRIKQSRLLQAARTRGLAFQTRVDEGALFARLNYVPE